MTDIPSIQLIRLQNPPPGHDSDSFARWRTELGDLMAELKHAAKKVVARTRSPAVLALLDSVQECRTDPVGFGLVEHLYEFAAFHVPGRSGRTLAESSVDASEHLPESLRGYLEPLAASHWELYEVTGPADSGAISLRRLHDDQTVELDALEMPQPFVAGTVQAFRIFDAGGFQAAPVALVLEQGGIASLVSQIEVEQPGPFATRADYMRGRGSALILHHALRRHVRRLAERRPMPEPSVSLVESKLPVEVWRQLDEAFGLLESAIGDKLSSLSPLVMVMPGGPIPAGPMPGGSIPAGSKQQGPVLRVEQNGPAMALVLFDTLDEHKRWETCGQAERFVRVWRADVDELFSEDVALLERVDLAPERDGAVVAVRLEEQLWEDVDAGDVDAIIDACRWAALRVQAEGELAA